MSDIVIIIIILWTNKPVTVLVMEQLRLNTQLFDYNVFTYECMYVYIFAYVCMYIQGRAKVPERVNISENINFLKKWFRQKKWLKKIY